LRAKHRQRLSRRITVKVRCVRRCHAASAKGRIVVKGSKRARSFKLGHARRAVHKKVVVLQLRVPPRSWRAARKGLADGASVRARVRITLRSKKGAKLRSFKRTILLHGG
jgi:hypothetical protein